MGLTNKYREICKYLHFARTIIHHMMLGCHLGRTVQFWGIKWNLFYLSHFFCDIHFPKAITLISISPVLKELFEDWCFTSFWKNLNLKCKKLLLLLAQWVEYQTFHPRVQGSCLCSGALVWASWWLSGKESSCQCRRHGFDLWVRKIPWKRKWQPLQYPCLGNSMDRRAWQDIVYGITNYCCLDTSHDQLTMFN